MIRAERLVRLAGLGVTGVLLSYLILRAVRIPYTHDEALAFFHYVGLPLPKIFLRATTATNHPLATAGAKICSALFGTHPLALRLPALLSFLVYAWAAFRLGRWLPSGLRLPAFLTLTLNPYLLEFFALARGYGPALAATLLGAERLVAYAAAPSPRRALGALGAFAAAVYANYTYLYPFAAALAYLVLTAAGPGRWPIQRGALLFAAGLGLLWAYPLWQLLHGGQLYYGGTRGFWPDTVRSLLLCTAHDARFILTAALRLLHGLVAVAVAVLAVLAAGRWRRLGSAFWREPLGVFCALLFGTALLTVGAHHLAGVPYLVNRTALLFWPLFFLPFFVALSHLLCRWAALPAWALAGLILVHTVREADLRTTLDWHYEGGTRAVLALLAQEEGRRPFLLGINWRFEPALAFYRLRRGWDWLLLVLNPDTHYLPLQRVGFPPHLDLYYVFPEDLQSIKERTRVRQLFREAETAGLGVPRLLEPLP